MNNRAECLPCCLRRVLQCAQKSTSDDWLRRKILEEAMQELSRVDDKAVPAEVIHGVARRAARTLGLADPYAGEKRRLIEDAIANDEVLRSAIQGSEDPFLFALHLSMAANGFDCELRDDLGWPGSVKTLIARLEEIPFVEETALDLRQAARAARCILFVHDSAGELYFDRLLLEKIRENLEMPGAEVFSAVRSVPILADATREDAERAGLGQVATIMDLGADCLGVPLSACSEEFREVYRRADLVVAKGQAALETLEGEDSQTESVKKRIFFLLRVKCNLLARHLGAAVGDCVVEAS